MTTMEKQDAFRREMRAKLLRVHGIEVTERSPDEWLQLALNAEKTKLDCGPFDPAFEFLSNQQRRYEEAAALAELNK